MIETQAPTHRMHHDVVTQIIADTSTRLSDATTTITCQEIHVHELTAEVLCQAVTKPPTQPRAKALDFVKALSDTQSLLVTYPSVLDMKSDIKSGSLTTEFSVEMTYIPARYEADNIQKLTYVKR